MLERCLKINALKGVNITPYRLKALYSKHNITWRRAYTMRRQEHNNMERLEVERGAFALKLKEAKDNGYPIVYMDESVCSVPYLKLNNFIFDV